MRNTLLVGRLITPVLALALAGCSTGSGSAQGGARTIASPLATGPASEGAAEPSVSPAAVSPSPSPTAPAVPTLPTYDVALVERQLTSLHYYGGPIDAVPGDALRSAVTAFQKVNGLGADGDVGPQTLAALKAPKPFLLQETAKTNRVEVDLTRQVLAVVTAGRLTRLLPVSSGNGATYHQKNGATAVALTPVGHFRILRRIIGPEVADLGTLYDPQYFYKGWAIHGSDSVPSVPASHGCIRVTRADATWLLGQLAVKMTVDVYGGTYTFPAGSRAAGTDTPTGDTPSAAPSPSAAPATSSPTTTPSASPAPTHSAGPGPLPSGTPAPSPT